MIPGDRRGLRVVRLALLLLLFESLIVRQETLTPVHHGVRNSTDNDKASVCRITQSRTVTMSVVSTRALGWHALLNVMKRAEGQRAIMNFGPDNVEGIMCQTVVLAADEDD